MRFSPLVLGIATASAVAVAAAAVGVDVSKGTELIPPGSKEAEAFQESDKAPKFAPKDNTFPEDFDKSKSFKKSQPNLSDQKIDIPDPEPVKQSTDKKKSKSKPVATKEDAPVVVNDYDPNNIGVSSEGKTQASEHLEKTDKSDKSEKGDKAESKDASSSSDRATDSKDRSSIKDTSNKDTKAKGSTSTTTQPHSAIEQLYTSQKDTLHALVVSVSMTVMSEIGDKTFLIAAIMAMRHNRLTVLTAAFSALVVMTVLSGVIGHALPTVLSKRTSSLLAGLLFLIFGFNLLREGLQMEQDAHVDEALEEVEAEIKAAELNSQNEDLELGLGEKNGIKRSASNPRISQDGLDNVAGDASLYRPRPRRSNAGALATVLNAWSQVVEGLGNLASLVLSPVWVQVFAMTFFAEWGDRSQIATIAMAAGSDYWFVILGSVFGHFLCTSSAVIGGKLLATKITLKAITLGGSFLFFVFSLVYFYEFLQG